MFQRQLPHQHWKVVGFGGPGRDRTDDLFHAMLFPWRPVIGFQRLTNRNIGWKRRVRRDFRPISGQKNSDERRRAAMGGGSSSFILLFIVTTNATLVPDLTLMLVSR